MLGTLSYLRKAIPLNLTVGRNSFIYSSLDDVVRTADDRNWTPARQIFAQFWSL